MNSRVGHIPHAVGQRRGVGDQRVDRDAARRIVLAKNRVREGQRLRPAAARIQSLTHPPADHQLKIGCPRRDRQRLIPIHHEAQHRGRTVQPRRVRLHTGDGRRVGINQHARRPGDAVQRQRRAVARRIADRAAAQTKGTNRDSVAVIVALLDDIAEDPGVRAAAGDIAGGARQIADGQRNLRRAGDGDRPVPCDRQGDGLAQPVQSGR